MIGAIPDSTGSYALSSRDMVLFFFSSCNRSTVSMQSCMGKTVNSLTTAFFFLDRCYNFEAITCPACVLFVCKEICVVAGGDLSQSCGLDQSTCESELFSNSFPCGEIRSDWKCAVF